MKKAMLCIWAMFAVLLPMASLAEDCWVVSNIQGYSAYADQGYRFQKDGIQNNILICFTSDGGTVTGTDMRFVKFGKSTLVGYGGNDKGNETLEVYQLDRQKRKLLYTKCRIGTKTVMPILSDVVCSYVGDATKFDK